MRRQTTKPSAGWLGVVSLITIGASLSLSAAAWADQPGNERALYQLELPSTLSLAPITATELGFSSTAEVILQTTGGPLPPANLQVLRPLPGFWRTWIPPGHCNQGVAASIDVFGNNGQRNQLSQVDAPDAAIQATAIAQPARIVDRDRQFCRVEGDALLQLDLSNARIGGAYGGTLRVTINRL